MATQFIYNPTDSPVVLDAEGHTVGGGEWGWADSKFVGDHLDAGRLVKADKPAKDADAVALNAYDNKPTSRSNSSSSGQE
jgi:hypothetical protein